MGAPSSRRAGGFLGAGGLVLLAVVGAARTGSTASAPLLIPPAALLLAAGLGRLAVARHPDEPWLGRWIVAGVAAKLVASWYRFYTLQNEYGGVGDAAGYDGWGRQLAAAWFGPGNPPKLPDLRRTNFIRWFTGVVYETFGTNMMAGFFVFGLLAVIGSYLWYRAATGALPFLDRRLFLGLVLFAPSVVFWPSSIGKESLMQLGIGSVALGTSLLLRQRLVAGLAAALPGGWLLWVVRPHLLALVTIAAAVAYFTGRVPSSARRSGNILSRPVGLLVVAFLVSFTVSQGAQFLGLKDLSLNSVDQALNDQTQRSAQGGSQFDTGKASLNPIYLPRGAVTVLLRPFPWETETGLQLLASLESAVMAGLIVARLRSLRRSLVRARARPFLLYAWILTLLYAATFSSFANFGLLVRQRSLVLPALFVLLALDQRPAHGDPGLSEREPARAGGAGGGLG